jgi:hypothetical protein
LSPPSLSRPFPAPFPPADSIPGSPSCACLRSSPPCAWAASRMKVDVLGMYSTYTFFRFVGISSRRNGADSYPVCTRCGMRVKAVAPTITCTALSWDRISTTSPAPFLPSPSSPAPRPPLPLLYVILDSC